MRNKLVFFVLFLCSCRYEQELPVLNYFINDSGKVTYYNVANFEFTNQNNQKFKEKDIENIVFIANFFFTHCPSICPKMKSKLIDIAKEFEDEQDFFITSFTIDPKNDSVSILKSYSETTKIPDSKWLFLNGSEEELSNMATLLRTSFKNQDNSTDFYHSSFVALIDRTHKIRGFYDLLDAKSVEYLTRDIKFLLK